jgi:Ca-activated chloride channel family protein
MNHVPALDISLTPLKSALLAGTQEDFQLLIRLSAKTETEIARTPIAVVLVIDRSSSMRGKPLQAAKDCCFDFVNRLHDQDQVSVVIYDDRVKVLLELTSAREAKTCLAKKLDSFDIRGCTNLHGGWLTGANKLLPLGDSTNMCRVLLLSDGQANRGLMDVDSICYDVASLATQGVTTTTVGLGLSFNENLMTAMAISGYGTAMYGVTPEDLAEPFDAEISLLSQLVWHDVKLKINSPLNTWKNHNDYVQCAENTWQMPAIAVNTEAWMALTIDMDELMQAVSHIEDSSVLTVEISAKDSNGVEHEFSASLPLLPIVSANEYKQLPIDETVQKRFAEIAVADFQRQARVAVRKRDFVEVERLLQQLEECAADNIWLKKNLEELRKNWNQKDLIRMEKELMYSSYSMKNRLTELNEGEYGNFESDKPAHLRRKTSQGRHSDSF